MKKVMWSFLLMFGFWMTFMGCKEVEAATKIHYIGLKSSTDAILLECDGRFGLVDSGEDWDYPTGNDQLYPFRTNIETKKGYDQQVIYYLKSVGVTSSNLDFYIGTHAHSDHIGTGDEIINYFKPKKVYLKKYYDSSITENSRKWDNLYVYNTLLSAAAKQGVEVIQNLSEGMTIKLGSKMQIQLYNTKVNRNVRDENENSLVAKVKCYNKTTLLTGDMESTTAWSLIKKKSIGAADVLKLPHHGLYANNEEALIAKFKPKTAIVTGSSANLSHGTKMALQALGTAVYSTNSETAAVVTQYSAAGSSTQYKKISAGWLTYEGGRYYLNSCGRISTGWKQISGKWYYFNKKGKALTGWQKINNKTYYLAKTKTTSQKIGEMMTGWQIINGEEYYFRKRSDKGVEGAMLTGWQLLNNNWYYFNKSGANGVKGKAATGFKQLSGVTYYFNTSGKAAVRGRMCTGWQTVGGQNYYFKKTGAAIGKMLTGWQTLGGKQYYFKKTGSNGEKGRMLSGWQTLASKQYYFKKTGSIGDKGRLLTGWQTLGGQRFYFKTTGNNGDKGRMLSGWQTLSQRKYYFRTDGAAGTKGSALTGWNEISDKAYYFAEAKGKYEVGQMVTGWYAAGDYCYYLNTNGTLFDIRCQTLAADSLQWSEWERSYQYNAKTDSSQGIAAFTLQLQSPISSGNITYSSYRYDSGWEEERTAGQAAGDQTGALEAVRMNFTGTLSAKADLYYRVYLIDYGWLGWTRNGETAGTLRGDGIIGAIQIQVREKGDSRFVDIAESVLTTDLTRLQQLTDTALQLREENYTPASWAEFAGALAAAQEALQTGVKKQSEIALLADNLEAALAQLEATAANPEIFTETETVPNETTPNEATPNEPTPGENPVNEQANQDDSDDGGDTPGSD